MTTKLIGYLLTVVICASVTAQDKSNPAATQPEPIAAEEERDPLKILLAEVAKLRDQVTKLRQELAECELQSTQANRELEELRQFVSDHAKFGDDFEKYQSIKEIADRDERREEAQANRARQQAEKAERLARLSAARAQKAQRDAQASKVAHYRKAGFTPLGLDVYTSKMAYSYETKDASRTRIAYDPFLGHFLRTSTTTEIDFSQMTISGSVLNASGQTRNVGVAITFFDESGNQVGHETVQISNARPDVPYPFTSTLEMALNRPFASSSTYVLYADVAEDGDGT